MVESEWLRCRGWLVPVLTDATEDEVLAHLRFGTAMLWPGERSAFVTQCVLSSRSLHVWLAAGDRGELLSMIPGMAAWGRAMGCEWATVNGRKGWARVLKPYGFEWRDGELWKAL